MSKQKNEEMYDVESYTDEELITILDLVNPTDRELEAKIIMSINKYSEDPTLSLFFEKIYDHFFETIENEDEHEQDYEIDTSERHEETEESEDDNRDQTKTNKKGSLIEGLSNRAKTENVRLMAAVATARIGSDEEESEEEKKAKNTKQIFKDLSNSKVRGNAKKPLVHNVNFEYTPGKLNPLLKETQKRLIHIDSRLRENPSNDTISTQKFTSTNFIINLSDTLLDVVAIRLHSVNIPYTWYNISNTYNANYFIIYSTSPGLVGKYSFKFIVPVGNYEINSLILAVNDAITKVKNDNTDVYFGPTMGITYSAQTIKATFTIDIKNIFTENNYSVVVPSTIAETFGWIETSYPFNAITSDFSLAKQAEFQSTDIFQVIQNTLTTPGNNYFTVYNYNGNSPFNLSDPSSIYNIITITLPNINGTQTRRTIVNALTNALISNSMLDPSSTVQFISKTYTDASGQIHAVEQYEMIIYLNRKTTQNQENIKQIVIFPNESALSLTGRPLWTGSTSCFLFDQSSNVNVVKGELPISTSSITINRSNSLFNFRPVSNSMIDSSANNISFIVPIGTYSVSELCSALNMLFSQNVLTQGTTIGITTDASNNQIVQLYANINKVFTTNDYTLQFYDEVNTPQHLNSNGSINLKPVKWDVTLGWILGYRSATQYPLFPRSVDNTLYVYQNNYNYNSSTKIVTLTSDTCISVYLFNNLFLIVDDFTQNHLNDGLVTITKQETRIALPTYANKNTQQSSIDGNPIVSFDNSVSPGIGITQAQTYSATEILENSKQKNYKNNVVNKKTRFTDPPYLKDMFAIIPLKLNGLSNGATFSEFGGALQDNDRKYFGTVNIRRLHIKLINDYGDVLELNNANWSFSFVCEYLYTSNRT